jgi:hypothetical protein
VHNTGKVAFDFSVSGSASAVGLFDITPMQGVCVCVCMCVCFRVCETDHATNISVVHIALQTFISNSFTFPSTLNTLSGKVPPGGSQCIVFTVRPATPSSIAETFFIKMAHFERVPVQCYCDCIFSAVVANLPRQKKMGEFHVFDVCGAYYCQSAVQHCITLPHSCVF